MLRFLNISVVTVLIASAGWAYQTKYETIGYAESVRKLEIKVEKERDAISILKAEWQLLNRPARLEELSSKLNLKPVKATQVGRIEDLPNRGKDIDRLADKLDQLLTGSIATPHAPRQPSSKTPSAKPVPTDKR